MKTFFFSIVLAAAHCILGAQVTLSTSAGDLSAGNVFEVKAEFKVPEGSYLYYKDPGQTGLPTTLKWTLPPRFKVVAEDWPKPQETTEMDLKAFVYKKDFEVTVQIEAPNSLTDGKAEIRLEAEWLKCTNLMCQPGSAEADITISTLKSAKTYSLKDGLFLALAGAFAGGMILNLMPCVFPVIGLKILSFTKDAADSRAAALKNALLYSLGIITSFLVLAFLLVWLKSMGGNFGWGFQLQNPVFVAVMVFLFFGMGLSMAGLFEFGPAFSSLGTGLTRKGCAAFLSGVLAVLVASPCTAPFMASSLGLALASDAPAQDIFLIFTFLGLGMASPYVLLSAVPKLSALLPKPGEWMETFKQFLSYPMFATAIWLLWVFLMQTGADSLLALMFSLLVFAFALWILGKWASPVRRKITRVAARIIFAVLVVSSLVYGIGAATNKPESEAAAPDAWSDTKVEELRKNGKMVYVDFTASWCITCLANKKAVLSTDEAEELFKENNIALLRADWTSKDESITRKLAEFGRSGVPLNVIYPADPSKKPVVLPELLTMSSLHDAIDKAKQ